MGNYKIWVDWLPEPFLQDIKYNQPETFSKIVTTFKKIWEEDKEKEIPKCFNRIKDWFPTLTQFMYFQYDFNLSEVETLVNTCLDIVYTSKDAINIMDIFSSIATFFLKKYKKHFVGKIVIEWSPLYKLMLHLFGEKRTYYEGEDTLSIIRDDCLNLIKACSPFFPLETTAGEVWSEFKSKMCHSFGQECFEALGWFVHFMPTSHLQRIKQIEDDGTMESSFKWNESFNEWLDIFERGNSCLFWNIWWFEIFGSLAENDTLGVIQWDNHIERLCCHIIDSFGLPMGRAASAYTMANTVEVYCNRANTLFKPSRATQVTCSAKILVHCLGDKWGKKKGLECLENMINLIEQFYHPSNGGHWTSTLALFVKQLSSQFMKRLARQNKLKDTRESCYIGEEMQKACVQLLLKIASRGQYAKNDEMRVKACEVISQLAFVSPQDILPMVFNRFRDALDTMTATSTLPVSIHALALCVRPLLLSSYQLNLLDDNGDQATAQALSEAMMAVLPGIDANDTAKTAAVFRLYVSIFFNIPRLDQNKLVDQKFYYLPLDVESWSEELGSRLFVLLENLEGPEQRTDQSHVTEKMSSTGTFLLRDSVYFEPFLDMLMIKLSESNRKRLIKRFGDFVYSNIFPWVVQEVKLICGSMVQVDPDSVKMHITVPIMEKLLDMIPENQNGKINQIHLSHSLITSISWNLHLLSTCILYSPDYILENFKLIADICGRCFSTADIEIRSACSSVIECVFRALVNDYPVLQKEIFQMNILPNGINEWVSKKSENWPKTKWHIPTEREIKVANYFIELFLEKSIDSLIEFVKKEPKEVTEDIYYKNLSDITKIYAVLQGCCEYFVDFQIPKKSKDLNSSFLLKIAPEPSVTIGKPGTRERLASLLCDLCSLFSDEDPLLLNALLELIEVTLFFGDSSPPDKANFNSTIQDDYKSPDTIFKEPVMAVKYYQQNLKASKRWPFYSCISRLWGRYDMRKVVAAYQRWTSSTNPMIRDIEQVPVAYGSLFGHLLRLCLNRYEDVSENARVIAEKGLIRFPCFADIYFPSLLMALTRQDLPDDFSSHSLYHDKTYGKFVDTKLTELMMQIDQDVNFSRATHDSELSVESGKDAIVLGTISLMSSTNLIWKGIFSDPKTFAYFIYAIMGTRINTDLEILQNIRWFVGKFMIRFFYPSFLRNGLKSEQICEMHSKLTYMGKEGVLSNWKYSLLANILILITLPSALPHGSTTAMILDHFINMTTSKLMLLRKMGLIGIYAVFTYFVTMDEEAVERKEFLVILENQFEKGLANTLIEAIINNQDSLSEDLDGSKGPEYFKSITNSNSLEEELVNNGYHYFIERMFSWLPQGQTAYSFVLLHAKVIEIIMQITPEIFLSRAKPKITELLNDIASDKSTEKNIQKALAEILPGISTSSYIHHNGKSSEWNIWVRDSWKSVLNKGSLDSIETSFSKGLKFSIHTLVKSNKTSSDSDYKSIVNIFDLCFDSSNINKNGNQSYEDIKRIRLLFGALGALLNGFVIEDLPEMFIPIVSRSLDGIYVYMEKIFLNVRGKAAALAVYICSYILSTSSMSSPQVKESLQIIKDKARCLCETIFNRFYEGIIFIQEAIESSDKSEDGLFEMTYKIGFACQFAISIVASPYFIHSIYLRGLLFKFLPGLLKIQEIGIMTLKHLQDEAVSALSALTLIRANPSEIPSIINTLKDSLNWSQWHSRHAALLFAQNFWFDHFFILTPEESESIREYVLQSLKDKKLEVQLAASSILSGMIKVMSPSLSSQLRNNFINLSSKLFQTKNGETSTALKYPENERHSVVLGLKAFVTAYPYNVPEWMPEVLMAIVPAASERPPIRTTATTTLSEFRRTHVSENHQELRSAFNEEQWDIIQGVGSQASYFT